MQHTISKTLSETCAGILKDLYQLEVESIDWQATRKEFAGDLTLVVFPYLKASRKKPEDTAQEIGTLLQERHAEVEAFNVVKGFLNISISDSYWQAVLHGIQDLENYGKGESVGRTTLVEYSSPNTNKPLHLGHIRNNLLGYSVAEILSAAGHTVKKVQIINDRGIHICKSMVAWSLFGNDETPKSTGLKGDHLVGRYYVEFEKRNKREVDFFMSLFQALHPKYDSEILTKNNLSDLAADAAKLRAQFGDVFKKAQNGLLKLSDSYFAVENHEFGYWLQIYDLEQPDNSFVIGKLEEPQYSEEVFLWHQNFDRYLKNEVNGEDGKERNSLVALRNAFKHLTILLDRARVELNAWEAGEENTIKLWEKMNSWVYEGFKATYDRLGVNFDKNYYESETYLLGKKIVEQGLNKGVFFKKEDGSVWCDLEAEKLGEKLLLRRDGTSVYMTQDIGTAIQRYEDFGINGMIYTVGNEQDYHFQVLFAVLKKLGYAWAENLYHLSYGMVDLPSGKMKSREGTVVDADDLMEQMISTAQKISEDLGKTDGLSETEKKVTHEMIGLGALKYFILKVDPRKRMLFNPEESIDFQGNTGPFIQYTHARIKSLLRKASQMSIPNTGVYQSLAGIERELIKQILNFPSIIQQAAADHAPSLIANYVYDLVKTYNGFYQQLAILNDENPAAVHFRIDLSRKTAAVVSNGMRLLGITVPEQM